MINSEHPHTSLSEVHETIDTTKKKIGWRKIFSFLGPAYLVSVGYMDPGNWATDLAGGSKFGYSLVAIVAVAFLIEIILAKPVLSEVAHGFIPKFPNDEALYIAIGIIGATVMPHNLYLHSALVQTRKIDRTKDGIKQALKFNRIDSTIALNLAFLVNAAILIMAAKVFFTSGHSEVAK